MPIEHKPKFTLREQDNLAMYVLIDEKINLVLAQVDCLALAEFYSFQMLK